MTTLVALALAVGGWATGDTARIGKGRAIYEQACALCHGRDGRGNPDWPGETRPVALDDCTTTAEPTSLWKAIVRDGGAAWGLSSVMPAFGEAYDDGEIGAAVAYMRTFCPTADRYPPGDLNFRRLLATPKAFPEMEWVLRLSHRPDGDTRETELEAIYENRIGPRFQYEFEVPLRLQARERGQGRGLGDVTAAAKHVLAFDVDRLAILSGGVEVALPTGSRDRGLGAGSVGLSPFLSFGKAWNGGRTIVQGRVGTRIPVGGDGADPEGRYAVAFSRALGHPRVAWTPAVEVVGSIDLESSAHDYAIWLETSKALNKLGHVIASGGVQIPIRPAAASPRVEIYVLWDFGDGPFWEGW